MTDRSAVQRSFTLRCDDRPFCDSSRDNGRSTAQNDRSAMARGAMIARAAA